MFKDYTWLAFDSLHFDLVCQHWKSTDFLCRMLGKLFGVVSERAPSKDKALLLNQNAEPAYADAAPKQVPPDERFQLPRWRGSRVIVAHAVLPVLATSFRWANGDPSAARAASLTSSFMINGLLILWRL